MEQKCLIGKYTLESLTSGLYLTPLDLYREYVQNATDSIDNAISERMLESAKAKISICIDSMKKTIRIEDNGTGVSEKHITETLIDIGNSQKSYSSSRGFRGIGRLSGLGYCKKLSFVTSYMGERTATCVEYDAALLQDLLSPKYVEHKAVEDVLEEVVSISTRNEDAKKHYFAVTLSDVTDISGLLDRENIIDYLEQTLPLPFSPKFAWGSMIEKKIEQEGYSIPNYNVELVYDGIMTTLYKPYQNAIYSDRVRRVQDPIVDLHFRSFSVNGKTAAVLWYAETNYYGTILDSLIRGIRVRHGNILLGDDSTLRGFYKEERFNGWLCGELHFISDSIIPNTRRDNFEKTADYIEVMEQFSAWTNQIAKEIRKRSYQRSLSVKEISIIEDPGKHSDAIEEATDQYSEAQFTELSDSEELAENDLFGALSQLANAQAPTTKYRALNINSKLSNSEKQTYARVFDIIYRRLSKNMSGKVVQIIIDELSS